MPYTQGLLESIPVLGEVREKLAVIPGNVPSLIDLPPGCRFAARCLARVEHGLAICTETDPALLAVEEGHQARCWLYHDHPPSGFEAPMATSRSRDEAIRIGRLAAESEATMTQQLEHAAPASAATVGARDGEVLQVRPPGQVLPGALRRPAAGRRPGSRPWTT